MDSYFNIKEFIESRENYYFKVFREKDIKKFNDEANKFIEFSNKWHNFRKPLSFKNRCSKIFLGIASELILKAAYLKLGYFINQHKDKKKKHILFKVDEIKDEDLSMKTHSFGFLIRELNSVLPKHNFDFDKDIRKGLEIARIWRNINAHTITSRDIWHGDDHINIEKSLKILTHLARNPIRNNL